jgi:hypothetical protein
LSVEKLRILEYLLKAPNPDQSLSFFSPQLKKFFRLTYKNFFVGPFGFVDPFRFVGPFRKVAP